MTTTKNKMFTAIAIFAMIMTVAVSGCKKEKTTPNKTSYELKVKDQLGISGTVVFTETNSTTTTVEIVMSGGDATSHPAHIHFNSAIEGGGIAISLNPVVNGRSTTLVTKLDNNSAVNYSQLIMFDGYLNVHQSSVDLATILAQSDIGGNALTTSSKSYNLAENSASGVSGTVLFEKRKNGFSLVTISVNGTLAGGQHPSAIHIGSVASVGGGPITKTLHDVDGTTGKSYTNLRTLNDGTPFSYDNMLVYTGYVAVHESDILMASVLCMGNIGAN